MTVGWVEAEAKEETGWKGGARRYSQNQFESCCSGSREVSRGMLAAGSEAGARSRERGPCA